MFYYEYQQIFSTSDGNSNHFEALFRCSESNEFCRQKLESICLEKQLNKVLEQLGHDDFYVHFNIEPTITEFDLKTISNVCEKFKFNKRKFVLEVVESGEISVNILKTARNLGFSLALDDLGKGSSLYNIQPNFFYDYIKFDRAWLISPIHTSLLTAVIEKLRVLYPMTEFIIEGVETEGSLNFAKNLNVQFLQGFHLERPKKCNELFMNNSKSTEEVA